eukprot:scaffold250105_cov19-Tisochrysis_lutea.AAC.1
MDTPAQYLASCFVLNLCTAQNTPTQQLLAHIRKVQPQEPSRKCRRTCVNESNSGRPGVPRPFSQGNPAAPASTNQTQAGQGCLSGLVKKGSPASTNQIQAGWWSLCPWYPGTRPHPRPPNWGLIPPQTALVAGLTEECALAASHSPGQGCSAAHDAHAVQLLEAGMGETRIRCCCAPRQMRWPCLRGRASEAAAAAGA